MARRRLAEEIAAEAKRSERTVAAAESVSAGMVATSLAAAPDAAGWFCGSVVAYRTEVKRASLGVTSERIVSAECAAEMVRGVLALTGADVAVATTGVGGPDPQEGRAPGTVFIAAGGADGIRVHRHTFRGSPARVVRRSAERALEHLLEELRLSRRP